MKWTHDALQEDLAKYVREKARRMVWSNMQVGAAGSPRPDAYSLPFSFSRFTRLADEVKVSVADFRRDATAGMWQSYLRYAAGVTFAAPDGLNTKADIPKGSGLLPRSEAARRRWPGRLTATRCPRPSATRSRRWPHLDAGAERHRRCALVTGTPRFAGHNCGAGHRLFQIPPARIARKERAI